MRYDPTTGNYLRYDAENRLIGVGSNVSYVYNGQGQRVEKNLSGVKTDYLYDLANHVITAFQSASTWQRGEIYAGGWHLGTYYPNATYFSFTDSLVTEHYTWTEGQHYRPIQQVDSIRCHLGKGDDVNFHQYILRQPCDLYRRARRRFAGKVAPVYLVHRGKVVHRFQEHGRLDHLGQRCARGCEYARNVLQHPIGLRGDISNDELLRGWIKRDLAG